MIIYPHWWRDDGTCDLDCREWKDKSRVFGCEVDPAIVAEYQRAEAAWDAARKALWEAIDEAPRLPATTNNGDPDGTTD